MLRCKNLSIRIRNLRVPTIIGVYDHERVRERELILNLELKISENAISLTDHLCDTVDYGFITRRLYEAVNTARSHLLEHLGQIAAKEVFKADDRIQSVDLEIYKSGCIVGADGAAVSMFFVRE